MPMKQLALALFSLLGSIAWLASAAHDIIDSNGDFLPYSEATDLTRAEYRALSSSSSSSNSKFIDSTQYYDGYQQAWRMLGFYIDCSERGRAVQGHSHDSRDQSEMSNSRCVRYLIWAAYIDTDYEGGGIGEYMHYNSQYNAWDTSPCETHGNGRCAPMDCHMTNSTTWQLLGVYKEAQYASEWFEQLFKHAGYCLWSYSVYTWMQTYRENWPEGCISTGTKSPSGNYIYTDLKPSLGGNITLALYEDIDCRIEYNYANVSSVLEGKYLTGDASQLFNDAMEPYKYCQPCRAAALSSSYGSDDDGGRRRRLEDDPNDGYFECNDDAGYTNVNQCMKFRTHTTLYPMTMRDVEDASKQGGMLPIAIGGKIYGQSETYSPIEEKMLDLEEELDVPLADILLVSGSVVMGVGAIVLGATLTWIMRRRYRFQQGQGISSTEPLMSKAPDHVSFDLNSTDDYQLH